MDINMIKLVFDLERDWIQEKREIYKNPVRKMEKFITEYEGVTLVKSDYTSFTVELEKVIGEKFTQAVGVYIQNNFDEQKPWKYIKVTGDTEGICIPTEEDSETSNEEKSEVAVQQEEPVEAAPSTEELEEIPIIEKAESLEENLSDQVPLKYMPELAEYIKELGNVISMLKKMHADECIWSQNLLVSIDRGYGFSSFLKALARVYVHYEVAVSDKEMNIKEIVIANDESQDKKYSDWKSALNRAREMANENKRSNKCIILSMDISQWQNELHTTKVLEYLRQINEAAVNFICVFKVPFMEGQVLQQIKTTLLDVMDMKALTAAPISIEKMVDYMKNEITKINCEISDACDDVLEQWIIQEKQDDSFWGYKTLDKMVRQIIYRKALLNAASGVVSQEIGESDIHTLLELPEAAEDPYALLENLIGIAEVKQKIKEIVIQIKTQKEMAAAGTFLDIPSIHMVFTGKPGTGKTTVARILAKIMKKENILRKGHFYEIQGRNLCGRYVGETAPKTSTYCRDAYGSILFIDEAYSLYQGEGERDYGKEAIQTLLAEMENQRDDFCVIMAGYKDEMEKLMHMNPGLESRIPYVIDFPDYTPEELEQIFFKMIDGKIQYSENLREAVKEFFASIPQEVLERKDFSNARLVRNLFERVWGKAAYRRSLSGDTELEIRKEDLLCASEEADFRRLIEKKERKHIGFIAGK